MYAHTVLLDVHYKHHLAELERQIAHDRLVAEATRAPGRSLRTRLADALYALAELVADKPIRAEQTATA